MYRLGFNASSFSHRVLTGTWRRRATRCPSYRHGRAVPEAASGGTGAKSIARHREVPILFLQAGVAMKSLAPWACFSLI